MKCLILSRSFTPSNENKGLISDLGNELDSSNSTIFEYVNDNRTLYFVLNNNVLLEPPFIILLICVEGAYKVYISPAFS